MGYAGVMQRSSPKVLARGRERRAFAHTDPEDYRQAREAGEVQGSIRVGAGLEPQDPGPGIGIWKRNPALLK